MIPRLRPLLVRVGLVRRTNDETCGLSLRIEPVIVVVAPKAAPRLMARLTNNGPRPVTLVLPGDGSRMGRRTPILEWLFTPGGRLTGFEGCGNINPLTQGEVFTLQPGESRELHARVAPLTLPPRSRFRGVLVYTNDPDLPFRGVLLRPHHEGELARLRSSDRCRVQSNEIEFQVERDPML